MKKLYEPRTTLTPRIRTFLAAIARPARVRLRLPRPTSNAFLKSSGRWVCGIVGASLTGGCSGARCKRPRQFSHASNWPTLAIICDAWRSPPGWGLP